MSAESTCQSSNFFNFKQDNSLEYGLQTELNEIYDHIYSEKDYLAKSYFKPQDDDLFKTFLGNGDGERTNEFNYYDPEDEPRQQFLSHEQVYENEAMLMEQINENCHNFSQKIDASETTSTAGSSFDSLETTIPAKPCSLQSPSKTPVVIPLADIADSKELRPFDQFTALSTGLVASVERILQYWLRVTHKIERKDIMAVYYDFSARNLILSYLVRSGVKDINKEMEASSFISLIKLRKIALRVDKFQYQMKFMSKWASIIYAKHKGRKEAKASVMAKLRFMFQLEEKEFTKIFKGDRSKGMHGIAVKAILTNPQIRQNMLTEEYLNSIIETLNEQTKKDIKTNILKRYQEDPVKFMSMLDKTEISESDDENEDENEKVCAAMKEEDSDSKTKKSKKTSSKFKLPWSIIENYRAALEFFSKLLYRADKKEERAIVKHTQEHLEVITSRFNVEFYDVSATEGRLIN